jgi:CRP-like cAMP-binding protein
MIAALSTVHPCRNKLLNAIPASDLEQLADALQPVQLKAGRVVHHAYVPLSHFYFIDQGLVSIEAEVEHQRWAEVWQVGHEGCLGLPLLVGRTYSTYRRIVMIDGVALRIPRDVFEAKLRDMPSLRGVLYRYLFLTLIQASRLNACTLRHSVAQRVSRWLLLASDRYGIPALPITQSVIARALGIRRASVCNCLCELEDLGLLEKGRRSISLIDHRGLEQLACTCYRLIHKQVARSAESGLASFDQIGAETVANEDHFLV